MITERFKAAPFGWGDLYLIGELGTVLALPRTGKHRYQDAHTLKPHKTRQGYLTIALTRHGQGTRQYRLHRLVAAVWVSNPEGKPFVNHKDCNKKNNQAGNLEWCTHGENIAHAVANNRHLIRLRGSAHPRSVLTEGDVLEIRRRHAEGETLAKIAQSFGCSWATIQAITSGRHWKHVAA